MPRLNEPDYLPLMHMTRSENYSFDYCNVFREFDVVMMAKFLIATEKFLLPSETAV